MNAIRRFLYQVLAVATLVFIGAGTLHAQYDYWPNPTPYACTWLTQTGATGVALVTFTLGPPSSGDLTRSGQIRNFYNNGSEIIRSIVLSRDFYGGFTYTQTEPNVGCHLQSLDYARRLVFSSCSNGTTQNCSQWPQ